VPTNSSRADNLLPDSNPDAGVPVKSYARANQELAAAFDRYLQIRGFRPSTQVSYGKSVRWLVESLGSASIVGADRLEIRKFLGELLDRGVGSNTIRRHTASLRCFFRFLQLSGLRSHDPTLTLPHRRLPGRLQRVLTLKEIELLIAAGNSPLETAVAEFLYSTGVRVSELLTMRLEDVNFPTGVARVKKGKGGKDRIVLFGSRADAALRRMIEWRPPEVFLFEAPARLGHMSVRKGSWVGRFYDKSLTTGRHIREVRIGRVSDLVGRPRCPNCKRQCWIDERASRTHSKRCWKCPTCSKLYLSFRLLTHRQARRVFDRILAATPSYKPRPAHPYTAKHIREMVSRMGIRAGIGRVHPHALRRAFASHMLEGGADLRAIQDLLGHEKVTTTALYTSLSGTNLKEVHTRCHPMA
jgi:site-specific recombinase XerD